MVFIYFRHDLEETSFINFHDNSSVRSEFLHNKKRTDMIKLIANLGKPSNAFWNDWQEVINFNTIFTLKWHSFQYVCVIISTIAWISVFNYI